MKGNDIDGGWNWTTLNPTSFQGLQDLGSTYSWNPATSDSKSKGSFLATTNIKPSAPTLTGHSYSLDQSDSNEVSKLPVEGWRFGVIGTFVASAVTFAFNIAAAIYALVRGHMDSPLSSGPLIEIFHGSCSTTSRLNTWSHLVLNLVATILLAGSNYCMQCLVAPTRAEVDKAHAQARWLDIGLPSVRNLKHISKRRRFLWIVLCVTSLPVHLLFNSAFFASVAANDYAVIWAREEFLREVSRSSPDDEGAATLVKSALTSNFMRFELMPPQDCIETYGVDLLSNRRHVILVINDTVSASDSSINVLRTQLTEAAHPSALQYDWICDGGNGSVSDTTSSRHSYCAHSINRGVINTNEWRPSDLKVQYCLSERVPQECGFYINLAIIFIVLGANIVKGSIMAYICFGNVLVRPLMTIGDAIASFVIQPDSSTEGLTPIQMATIKRIDRKHAQNSEPKFPYLRWVRRMFMRSPPTPPKPLAPTKSWRTRENLLWTAPRRSPRYFAAASVTRWVLTISYFLLCLTLSCVVFLALTRSGDGSAMSLKMLGKATTGSLIQSWPPQSMSKSMSVISSVLTANTPQLALSFLYFALNTLLTLMASAAEWSRFSVAWSKKHHRTRTLRTSRPVGCQRRSYFLSLPFRFGIPLLLMSAMLHWLISQSIFLVVVSRYSVTGELDDAFAVTTCGYSPMGIVLVMAAGCTMMLGVGVFSLLKMRPGMPIMASCSAAISANCRVIRARIDDEGKLGRAAREEIVRGPMVWGEMVDSSTGSRPRNFSRELGSGPSYGFVSARALDWEKKVTEPLCEPLTQATATLKW